MSDRLQALRAVALLVVGSTLCIALGGCSAPPERLTLFYSLTCQACYEGARTQAMLARVNELRSRLPETRIEIVDVMIPGSGSRLATMAAASDADPDSVSAPVLFADGELHSGYEEIDRFLARIE